VRIDVFWLWTAAPYVLFALLRGALRPSRPSRWFTSISCLLSLFMLIATLYCYLEAAIHPNHNSGMVFVILPLILVPIFATVLIFARLISGR